MLRLKNGKFSNSIEFFRKINQQIKEYSMQLMDRKSKLNECKNAREKHRKDMDVIEKQIETLKLSKSQLEDQSKPKRKKGQNNEDLIKEIEKKRSE